MKKQVITPTGTKRVPIPLMPIRWVHHFSNGTPIATLALIRMLKDHLTLN